MTAAMITMMHTIEKMTITCIREGVPDPVCMILSAVSRKVWPRNSAMLRSRLL